ncbi:MAG: hypothetical protein ACYDBQ_10435 [Thermoplasmatota archaeon]
MRWVLVLLVGAAFAPGATAMPCITPYGEPPCGYIRPTLDLQFPSVPPCPAHADAARCLPLPANGTAVRIPGEVIWSWDWARDGNYPTDASHPITITFPPAHNPAFLAGVVSPPSLVLDPATLADPRYLQPGPDPAAPQLLFVYRAGINFTLTRHGDPTLQDSSDEVAAGGIAAFAVKAQSSASGAYFVPSFALKVLGFRVPLPAGHASGAPWGALAVAVALTLRQGRARRGHSP